MTRSGFDETRSNIVTPADIPIDGGVGPSDKEMERESIFQTAKRLLKKSKQARIDDLPSAAMNCMLLIKT